MFLTNVKMEIIFNNTRKKYRFNFKLRKFNTKTFETTFVKNVEVIRQNETITGDECYCFRCCENNTQNDLNKEQNILRISNNVLLQNTDMR